MSSPFKVLKLNEQLMILLRIYRQPIRNVTDADNDFFKSITTYCLAFSDITFAAASAVFVYQNVSDIMVALRTTLLIVGAIQSVAIFLSIGCKIDKIKVLQIKLQEIIDQTAMGNCSKNCFFNKKTK